MLEGNISACLSLQMSPVNPRLASLCHIQILSYVDTGWDMYIKSWNIGLLGLRSAEQVNVYIYIYIENKKFNSYSIPMSATIICFFFPGF